MPERSILPNFEPLLGLTGLGLLASMPGAQAQPAPSAQGSLTLPEIDVSATPPARYRQDGTVLPRLPASVAETPQSVTIVPRALIEEQGGTTIREALRNVTGISLAAGEGGFSGDNLTLRGFSARNDFFIDGIRDSAQYTRDPFFLESVEVLKGPSSILFGRGSPGGVINLSTRLPQNRNFGEFTLSGFAPFGVRTTGDVNIVAGNVGVRLNAMATRQDVAGRSNVTNDRWGIFPSITWGLGGNTQLTVSYLRQTEDNVPDFGLPFFNGRPVAVNRNNFYGLSGVDREQTRTDVVTGSVQHRFMDGLTLRSTLRYGSYYRDIDATAPRLIAPFTVNTPLANIMVNRQPQLREGTDTILQNQTELRATLNTGFIRHSVVTGFEVGRETSQLTRWTTPANNPRPNASLLFPNYFDTGSYTETRTLTSDIFTEAATFGAFAVDQMRIGEQFEVLLGGRYDRFDASSYNSTARTNFARVDDMFSYRAALVFKPTPTVRTYFSTGTSFNPSAEVLTFAAANANLAPERNRSFEIGASWDITRDLAVRGALFRIEKTNARTPDPVNGTINVLAGRQRADGFEISVAGRITPEWNIIAGYTYIDSVIESSNTPAEVGRQLLNTPRNTATVWTSYDLPFGLQLGGGATHISSRFGNNTNTVKIPGYTRYDLAASYLITQGLQARLNILNLTDRRFFEGVYSGNTTPGIGRTFLLTLAARF